jgi:hypothetical protein
MKKIRTKRAIFIVAFISFRNKVCGQSDRLFEPFSLIDEGGVPKAASCFS